MLSHYVPSPNEIKYILRYTPPKVVSGLYSVIEDVDVKKQYFTWSFFVSESQRRMLPGTLPVNDSKTLNMFVFDSYFEIFTLLGIIPLAGRIEGVKKSRLVEFLHDSITSSIRNRCTFKRFIGILKKSLDA